MGIDQGQSTQSLSCFIVWLYLLQHPILNSYYKFTSFLPTHHFAKCLFELESTALAVLVVSSYEMQSFMVTLRLWPLMTLSLTSNTWFTCSNTIPPMVSSRGPSVPLVESLLSMASLLISMPSVIPLPSPGENPVRITSLSQLVSLLPRTRPLLI